LACTSFHFFNIKAGKNFLPAFKITYNLYIFHVVTLNNNLTALTGNGTITGMEAREDGVYITYVPANGADAVTKKLGSNAKCKSITMLLRHQYGGKWENRYFTITISHDADGNATSAYVTSGASGNFGNSNPYTVSVSSCTIN